MVRHCSYHLSIRNNVLLTFRFGAVMPPYPVIVNEYKYLGVIIDSTLSWDAHVNCVVSKVVKKIGALRRAGNSLTQTATRQY